MSCLAAGAAPRGGSGDDGPMAAKHVSVEPLGWLNTYEKDDRTPSSRHLTGSACCVESATCTEGTAGSCTDPKEHWTGSACCVDEPSICVAGTAGSCTDAKEHWTGSRCCVEATACDTGTAGSCTAATEHWTGAMCCVE